jgi:hypothetical protein
MKPAPRKSPRQARYGWNTDGTDNPQQQAVIWQIVQWAAEGQNTRAIATKLNERGEPTQRGGKWAHATVQNILSAQGWLRRRP